MSRFGRVLRAIGTLAIVLGAILAVVGPDGTGSTLVDMAIGLLTLLGGVVVLWLIWSSSEDGRRRTDSVDWADVGPLIEHSPERTPSEYPLSTRDLSEWLDPACRRAKVERDPEAGLAILRDPLRETLVEALVAGGVNRDRAVRTIEEGTWTNDSVAAAALSGALRPAESRRQRLRNWLFPARTVRERTRRTVGEIADVADEHVPSVIGHNAPRRIPVRPPTLEEQRRGADGDLQPAAQSTFGYRWAETREGDEQSPARRDGS